MIGSDKVEIKIRKLETLLEKGDFNEASAISSDLEKKELSDSKALTLMAEVKVIEGDYNKAGVLARKAIDNNSLNVVARYVLACSLRKMYRYGEAAGIYRDIIRWNPDDPIAHLYLADALSDEGEIEEAINVYFKAIRLDKKGDVTKLARESILRLRGAG